MPPTTRPDQLVGWLTLDQLAAVLGVKGTDSLRQRLARGTLRGTKVGGAWLIGPQEVERVVKLGRNRHW